MPEEALRIIARVMAAKSHYDALNITADATAAEVKNAFRLASLSVHPDKSNEPRAEQAFQRLSEAHSVLSDTLKRRIYDYEQAQQPARMSPPMGAMHQQPRAPVSSRPAVPAWRSAEDIKMSAEQLARIEARELGAELAQLKRELEDERRAERERSVRHEAELAVQRRLTAEARAERDRIKSHWEDRLAEETRRQQRDRAEATAKMALLREQAARERTATESAAAEAAGLREAVRVLVKCGSMATALRESPHQPLSSTLHALLEKPTSNARLREVLDLEARYTAYVGAQISQMVRRKVRDATECHQTNLPVAGCSWAPVRLGVDSAAVAEATADEAAAAAEAAGLAAEMAALLEPPTAAMAGMARHAGAVSNDGGGGSGKGSDTGGSTRLSVEKDRYGNFVVVERDEQTGAYTCSAPRLAAEARWMGQHGRLAEDYATSSSASQRQLDDNKGRSLTDSLAHLLSRLGLDQFRAALEDEEICDVPLLRSFGPMLRQNMHELGMDDGMITRLRAALDLPPDEE